jgi:hypothetical protein
MGVLPPYFPPSVKIGTGGHFILAMTGGPVRFYMPCCMAGCSSEGFPGDTIPDANADTCTLQNYNPMRQLLTAEQQNDTFSQLKKVP